MKPPVEPYLFFAGRCEEALEFYETTLGAKREMLMRFEDSPEPMPEGTTPPGWGKKVMHASLLIGSGRIMASDGCNADSAGFSGFSLSLAPANEAEAHRLFDALAEGGTVEMPLAKTFWSPCYGMLTDKFGIGWMVNVVAIGPHS
jgi:PhnB protein